MSEPTPPEAKELIRKFEEDEARRAAEKASRKPQTFSREKPLNLRNVTANDVEGHAMRLGCRIETGGGKHGKHIIGPDGREISLPVHGSTLATGTARSIGKWLAKYR